MIHVDSLYIQYTYLYMYCKGVYNTYSTFYVEFHTTHFKVIIMNPKTQSIISYLGILWLIPFFAGKEKRDSLSTYHLKQGFGLLVIGLVLNIAIYVISMIVPALATSTIFVSILLLILIAFGIITAANEVQKPLPVIGKYFEDKFSFIDN